MASLGTTMPHTLSILALTVSASATLHPLRARVRPAAAPPRAIACMTSNRDEPEPPNGGGKSLADVVGGIADASFDMFVMPGEAANSRYDRAIGSLDSTPRENKNETAFGWGGDTAESEALRLPTGVKAAERLTAPVNAPRAQWFERQGPSSDPVEMRRRIDEDTQRLSSEWTRLWAVCVVIALAIVGADGMPSGS